MSKKKQGLCVRERRAWLYIPLPPPMSATSSNSFSGNQGFFVEVLKTQVGGVPL